MMKTIIFVVLIVVAGIGIFAQEEKGGVGRIALILLGTIAVGILTNAADKWVNGVEENGNGCFNGGSGISYPSGNGGTVDPPDENEEDVQITSPVSLHLQELEVLKQGEYFYVGKNQHDNIYSELDDHLDEVCKDVNGNYYASDGVHYITYFRLNEEGEKYRSITYYLNQEYDMLSGTIYRPYVSLRCNFDWTKNGIVEIYGDGVLLENYSVSQDTYSPINININVSGVRELRISMSGGWKDNDWEEDFYMPKVCLADLRVTNNP